MCKLLWSSVDITAKGHTYNICLAGVSVYGSSSIMDVRTDGEEVWPNADKSGPDKRKGGGSIFTVFLRTTLMDDQYTVRLERACVERVFIDVVQKERSKRETTRVGRRSTRRRGQHLPTNGRTCYSQGRRFTHLDGAVSLFHRVE